MQIKIDDSSWLVVECQVEADIDNAISFLCFVIYFATMHLIPQQHSALGTEPIWLDSLDYKQCFFLSSYLSKHKQKSKNTRQSERIRNRYKQIHMIHTFLAHSIGGR